jgi:hypothetical protein
VAGVVANYPAGMVAQEAVVVVVGEKSLRDHAGKASALAAAALAGPCTLTAHTRAALGLRVQ